MSQLAEKKISAEIFDTGRICSPSEGYYTVDYDSITIILNKHLRESICINMQFYSEGGVPFFLNLPSSTLAMLLGNCKIFKDHQPISYSYRQRYCKVLESAIKALIPQQVTFIL